MFRNYHRRKNAKEVSLAEMFPNAKIETVEKPKKDLHFILKNTAALIGVCCFAAFLIAISFLMCLSFVAQVSVPVAAYWKALPEQLNDNISIGSRNVLYDINGKPFAEIYTQDRELLTSIDQISPYAIKGLVATEDKRFYQHHGFDLIGTIKAAVKRRGGGSGITQQLVKNLRFYDLAGKDNHKATEHSLSRKIEELKYALNYEKHHSKDEILLNYFNTVAFGGPNTYSIEKAAKYYFGKHAKDLTLAESAVLVGSTNAPATFNLAKPKNKEKYKARQKTVLSRMVAEKYITQAEADKAYNEELKIVLQNDSNGNCTSSKYPFYCEYVMDYLRESPKLGETQEERDAILAKGGLHIHTYLDPEIMDIAQAQLTRDYGNTNRIAVPIAVVQPGTGGVLTIAQNRAYGNDEAKGETTLNLPINPAGTGSTYKMITLATALNQGYTEKDLAFSSQCPWKKAGFDTPPGGISNSSSCSLQGGYLDYKRAAAYSSNTWFVELESRIGINKIKEFSKSVGLSAPDSITESSASYTLGTVENSVVDMAAAYATFPNDGVFCPATPVKDYKYADGSTPAIPDTYDPAQHACKRVLSPYGASIVLKAMRAVISGEIRGAFGIEDNIPNFDTAAKSGTNELLNSSWAHVSKNYSLYANLYDPKKLTDGIDNVLYRGRRYPWYAHVSGHTGSNILQSILTTKADYSKLNYDNSDTSLTPVPVTKRDFFVVPNVLGMTPQEALKVLQSLNIPVHLSKETKSTPVGYPKGVIVEQSIKGGTQLSISTKKELILYTN